MADGNHRTRDAQTLIVSGAEEFFVALKNAAIASVILFLAGTACFELTPVVALFERNKYAAREPFFTPPVYALQNVLKIRVDRYGKGYYAAPRNGRRVHKGIDVTAPVDAPILAAKSGRVIRAAEEAGYGKHIYLLHPDGLTTRYAHLNSLAVKEGDWVVRGQVIGFCGKTGNAGNPKMIAHLHFEIRMDKSALNPCRHGLFAPDQKFRY